MKLTNSAAISVLAMLLVLISGHFKLGVEAVIASISATYVIGRAGQKYGISTSLAKDPNSSVGDHFETLKD